MENPVKGTGSPGSSGSSWQGTKRYFDYIKILPPKILYKLKINCQVKEHLINGKTELAIIKYLINKFPSLFIIKLIQN